MKTMIRLGLIHFIYGIIFVSQASAQMHEGPGIRASLTSDQRVLLAGEHEWVWNENRLDLKLESSNDRIRVFGQTWLRYIGAPQLKSTSALYSKDRIDPWNLDMREAYVEVSRFLFNNLDVRFGRQRIAWGTADRFNPTDNLNPYDLEDLFDFGRFNGAEAINFLWHFDRFHTLQAVYLPFFRPANLPAGQFSDMLQPAIRLPSHQSLNAYSDHLHMPSSSFSEQASLGIRFRGIAWNFDYSFSYLYGRDVLPMLTRVKISPHEQRELIDIFAELTFPRHHIWGFDLAGSLGFAGIWAEMAVILPEKEIRMTTDYTDMLSPGSSLEPVITTIGLKREPYVKYVIGADYTFSRGTYLNLQFLHGFLHEKGRDNLNDYLIISAEKTLFQNKLRIRPIAGGASVADWSDVGGSYAVFYTPEFAYTGIDNLELSAGMYLFSGKGDQVFARLNGHNMISLKITAHF